MIQAKPVFLELLSASATQLQHDLERTCNEPLADELRERTLTLLELLLQVEIPHDWSTLRNLLLLMAPKMEQAGYRNEWAAYLERALILSREVKDAEGESALGLQLGILYQVHSRWNDAKQILQASAEICFSLDKIQTYANILNRLGYIARHQGDLSQAEQYANRALELLQDEDHERHFSLFVRGIVAADRLKWQEAEVCYRQSLEICQRCGDTRNVARRHRDIGLTLNAQNKLRPARSSYEQAIAMFDKLGDRVESAVTRMNLGIVYSRLGQPEKALDFYFDAEQVFRDVQDALQLGYVLFNQGVDYQEIGRFPESEAKYKAAIEIRNRISSPTSVIYAQIVLGELYLQTERFVDALSIFRKTLDALHTIEDSSVAERHKTRIVADLDKLPKC